MTDQTRGNIEAARDELLSRVKAGIAWAECEAQALTLAEAMLAEGMDQRAVVKELRGVGLSWLGAKQLLRAAKDRAETIQADPDKDAEELESLPEDATPVCPHCLEPVSELDHFCPKCLGPITAHASIGPMEQVYSYGRMCQRATSGKPRFVVVLGMWLIFGPMVLFPSVLLALGASGHLGQFQGAGLVLDMVALALIVGLIVLYAAILWKVTSRYVKRDPGADNQETCD